MAGPERYAWTVRLKPDKVDEYRALHAEPWPGILSLLNRANIGDYTIFIDETESRLFSIFTYSGEDLAADIARLRADPLAMRWHAVTDACQIPDRRGEDAWERLTEVFRLD